MKVTVLASGLKFPEGPVVTSNNRVFCVELLGGCITEYLKDTQSIKRYEVGGAPNGMMVLNDDTLVFCDAKNNSIRSLDINTGKTKTLANKIDGKPLNAPNDLIKDQDGNILFTCPGGSQNNPIGYMCVLTPAGDVSVIAKDMYFPNGLLLINNEENIIINETWQHRLLIGEWNKTTLTIENIKPFYVIGKDAEPDGLALSKDNLVYSAVYNTGMVWVFNTEGQLVNQIKLPGNCPTNLCFNDSGDLGLIVTEAEKGQLLSIT